MFIRLWETAKRLGDKETQKFCEDILILMKSIMLMVILNGKGINKKNTVKTGYTPYKPIIAVKHYPKLGG